MTCSLPNIFFFEKINSQRFDTWFKVQPLLMPKKLDFRFLDKQQNTCFLTCFNLKTRKKIS